MNKGAIEANEQLYRNGTMFILEMITERLDKIIKLLELRNSPGLILGSCSECTCGQIILCPIHGQAEEFDNAKYKKRSSSNK